MEKRLRFEHRTFTVGRPADGLGGVRVTPLLYDGPDETDRLAEALGRIA